VAPGPSAALGAPSYSAAATCAIGKCRLDTTSALGFRTKAAADGLPHVQAVPLAISLRRRCQRALAERHLSKLNQLRFQASHGASMVMMILPSIRCERVG
jgi:hypothetical protein